MVSGAAGAQDDEVAQGIRAGQAARGDGQVGARGGGDDPVAQHSVGDHETHHHERRAPVDAAHQRADPPERAPTIEVGRPDRARPGGGRQVGAVGAHERLDRRDSPGVAGAGGGEDHPRPGTDLQASGDLRGGAQQQRVQAHRRRGGDGQVRCSLAHRADGGGHVDAGVVGGADEQRDDRGARLSRVGQASGNVGGRGGVVVEEGRGRRDPGVVQPGGQPRDVVAVPRIR